MVLMSAIGVLAFGAETQFWSSATFEDFSKGELSNISLSREGALRLAPQMEEVFNSEQAVIWAVAKDEKGNVYLGTGHSGKVFRLGPNLKGTLIYTAPEPDVFALAADKQGNLFVGTSPDGKIYKVGPHGNTQEFYNPKAKYIWALQIASDGSLFVGTGDRGLIHRVQQNGTGEIFYDTQQRNVVSLVVQPDGVLVAGTEPNGLLYRVTPVKKGFVLYQAPMAEIRSLVLASDGSIYASAMGTASERRTIGPGSSPPSQPMKLQTTTSITVQAAVPAQSPGPGGDGGQQPGYGQTQQGGAGAVMPGITAPPVTRNRGARTRSALFHVLKDNTVDTIWESNSENAYDVLPQGETLLFSTDVKGRIYQMTAERQLSLISQTDQGQTTRLIPSGNNILATTAHLGKVFLMGSQLSVNGNYESEVRDAGHIAGWGTLRWTGEAPSGASVSFYARSGNSNRPDATWSDWTGPYQNASGELLKVPAARYLQWKAKLVTGGGQSPLVRDVTVAYLTRNRGPKIKEISFAPVNSTGTTVAIGNGAGSVANRLANAAANARRTSAGAAAAGSFAQRGLGIRWTASDPDEDTIKYDLFFRGENEQEWKPLAEDLSTAFYKIDHDLLSDGRYRIKVVANDATSNAQETARTAERLSAPFLLDSTPPQLELLEVTRAAGTGTARFRAQDKMGVIVRAEYSVDAETSQPVLSEDRVLDSSEETIRMSVTPLDEKEHLLTIRVYDSAGNVAVSKAVWKAIAR